MEKRTTKTGIPFYVTAPGVEPCVSMIGAAIVAGNINKYSIPLIKEVLKVGNYTIKDVLSFSSNNGLERLKKFFLRGISEDSPYYAIGANVFDGFVEKHPEFRTPFCHWRHARLFRLDDNGCVEVDTDEYRKANTCRVSNPAAVDFLDEVNRVCDLLNEKIVPAHHRQSNGNVNILRFAIGYDKNLCKFVPTEQTETGIMRYLLDPQRDASKLADYNKSIEDATELSEARAMSEIGLQPEDLEIKEQPATDSTNK